MSRKRVTLAGLASLALISAPLHAQPSAPPPADTSPVHRNFDANILAYAAFPLLIAIIIAIAASSSGNDDSPASA